LGAFQPTGLRVALGLGDQELEQRLRPALETVADLRIVAQCLAADQLLELVQSQQVDALVVAWTLHRLTDALLTQLERPGIALVMLVPHPEEQHWMARRGPVLPIDSQPDVVHQAIVAARPGGGRVAPRSVATSNQPVPLKAADRLPTVSGGVIAVTGGAGSPGRTTLALNLATALGVAVPTALVELDLCAPALAAYVDTDPSRNVCTLAHAVRDDPRAWGSALEDELQPLGSSAPEAVVLCGPPKREMRTSIAPPLVERLLDELAQRYHWVIVDVGPEWLGIDTLAASHRTALARAAHVVLVSGADFVGLWHARTALDQLERLIELDRGRVNLVINRHDPRFHHSRHEVEWHLGAPVVALIPFDQASFQHAISEQRPAVLDPSSRAGRALVTFAEGLHAGQLHLPLIGSARLRRPWWRRLLRRQSAPVVTRSFARADAARPTLAGGARSRV
jgi:MinD-like ATPase involved in chromosome partitioning or flagellar assembly